MTTQNRGFAVIYRHLELRVRQALVTELTVHYHEMGLITGEYNRL